MSRLIDHMLTLARFDSGQLAPRLSECDLEALARNTARELAPLAAKKGIRLVIESESPIAAFVDAFRLGQALGNLVDNAIAFAPEGSSVDISLRDAGDSACISVRDRGPGVPARDRQRLFTRFHRGAGGERPGYGIGLAIAKSVAELHGGRVLYEAAEPGSVFSIIIPKIRAN